MISRIASRALTGLSCIYLIGAAGVASASPPELDAWFGDLIRTKGACEKAGLRWYETDRLKGCLKNGTQTGVWEVWNTEEKPYLNFLIAKGNDQLNGPALAFFPTGEVAATMMHKDEKLVGLKTSYWKNGTVRETAIYRDAGDGKREGPTFGYAPHGGLTLEGAYLDDVLDGPYSEWSGGCVKVKQGQYIKGEEDGVWYTWTDKGVLESEGAWKLGQKVGIWKFHDPESAALVQQGEYVDGLREGLWTESFANAREWRKVEYEADKRLAPGPLDCELTEGQQWTVDYAERAEGCYAGTAPFGQRVGQWISYYETAEKRREETFDKNGVLEGPYTEYHKNGKVLVIGEFRGGIPNGDFLWWDENGKEFGRASISNGSGEWRAFYPDGKPRETGVYKEGRKNGEWTTWFPNGNKDRLETFANGVENGPMMNWYDTGGVKAEGEFAAGNRAGIWTAYYSNGRIVWRGAYDAEGNRTDVWESFFWEGGLKSKGPMLRDAEDGLWSFYYETGEMSSEGSMVAGKREGPWRFYWKNGDIWREVTYASGVEIGTGQGMCEDSGGDWVQMVDERAAGCQVCRWRPQGDAGADADGTPVELEAGEIPSGPSEVGGPGPVEAPIAPDGVTPTETPGELAEAVPSAHVARGKVIKAQEQEWVFWYPNGKREKEGFYSKGNSQGKWTFWYENGQVMLRGTFLDGVENGTWEGFYPDGTKRFSGEFVAGKEDGVWAVFGSAGVSLVEGKYADGAKVGPWIYYDDAGKKRDEGAFEADEEAGPWKAFWPSGAVKSEGGYEAGKRVGVWTWFREDGSEWRKATYVDGREARSRK